MSSMDTFSSAHQPDEGYSEDPLNPSGYSELSAALSNVGSSELTSWLVSNVSHLPLNVKAELTMTLLAELPTSVIAEIVQRLSPRLYIDFIQHVPAEICLKILGYLDPVSLVCVTQTCRAWHDLALDRKLWERLYHLEGWKVIQSEVDASETLVNSGIGLPLPTGRTQSLGDRDTPSDDGDLEMADGDREPALNDILASGSIFGSPSSSFTSRRPIVSPMREMDIDLPTTKGKGRDTSQATTGKSASRGPGTHVRSNLWAWDPKFSRYLLNWKYLYNMRRRLESNWELGKYTTFQFPHPDFPEEGHQECIYTLQFDAKYLVSGSRDQTMRIWNANTQRLVRPPLGGHSGSVLCLQFDADPAEDILVSGSSDSNVFIWKFSTGEIVQKLTAAHRESVLNVRFDKRVLVTSSKDKTIKIFNRRPLRYGDLGYGKDEMVFPVGTSIRRYGFEPDLAQELPVKPAYTMIGKLEGHGAAVNAIQVRDQTVVSVSGDRHIKVWNWPDQVCTQTIPAHDKGIACVEFDGRRIVSGSSDYEVCIFDAPTGLKVAQLRGHAHLVRTVQAGFGDMPYSTYEDEAEAKKVDEQYFRAVEAGEVQHVEPRHRRERRANAGSSRPQDVQAFGAKVPPGGGGGRKYGRIVSGSYDQSIIIWRRDKEGVWKPAHHLRQEEAAAAAQRDAAAAQPAPETRRPVVRRPPFLVLANLPNIRQHMMSATDFVHQAMTDPQGAQNTIANQYMALIDNVVPRGVVALREALASYPSLLMYNSHLQAAIDREPQAQVRDQLREVVTESLVIVTNRQSALQRQSALSAAAASAAGESSSANPPVGAGDASNASTAGPTAPTGMAMPSNATPGLLATPMLLPVQPAQAQNQPQPQPQPQPHSQTQTQVDGEQAGQAETQQANPAQGQHHPHMAVPEVAAAARVFKLQFDARKIICCSQATLIVGWDFCNKDAELEEVSRFFATID